MTDPTPPAAPDPVLPEVVMHLHRPNEPGTATVVRSEICTGPKAAGIVRHIELDVADTQLAGRCRAGQSFGVIPPGLDHHGKPHALRLYSIASPTAGEDGQSKVIATTVKRTIEEHHDHHRLFLGVASNYLCDLQVGDHVSVTGPNGKRFLLPTDQAAWNYVFFATGTGIAPFRGMLGDLYHPDAPRPARAALVMGAPYRTDLLYHGRFTDLAQAQPGFEYHTAISREIDPQAGRTLYVQDRLSTHAGLVELLSLPDTLVYICGIAGMEIGILQAMARLLPAQALARFLSAAPEAGPPEAWTRRMLHKEIKLTRRVFLEVY